jgi:acyl dehydratase
VIKFYEEFAIGDESVIGSHRFTREEIIDFATKWDPQRFHVDEEAAKASIFGGLCASGWHTGCVAMRLIVDSRVAIRDAKIARGEAVPPLGVSPGVTNMRWPNPTRPGDVVTYTSKVISMRETKRPQWGLVGLRTSGVNQHGLEAMSMEGLVFVARRGA